MKETDFFLQPCQHFPLIPKFVTNFLSEIWNLTSYFDDAVQRRKHKMETMKDDEVRQTTKQGIKQIDSQSEI